MIGVVRAEGFTAVCLVLRHALWECVRNPSYRVEDCQSTCGHEPAACGTLTGFAKFPKYPTREMKWYTDTCLQVQLY